MEILPAPISWSVPGCANIAPGDICDREGNIEGVPTASGRLIIQCGVVWVSPTQAKAAKPFGWSLVGEPAIADELVRVKRRA